MVSKRTFLEDGVVLHAGELEPGLLQVVLLYPQVERLLKLRAVVVPHNRSLLSLQLLKEMAAVAGIKWGGERVAYTQYLLQGDNYTCSKPPVDFKTQVPFWPKSNFCFEANGRFYTT